MEICFGPGFTGGQVCFKLYSAKEKVHHVARERSGELKARLDSSLTKISTL